MTTNWIWVCKVPSSELDSFLPPHLCLLISVPGSPSCLLTCGISTLPFIPGPEQPPPGSGGDLPRHNSVQMFPLLPTLTQDAFVAAALTTVSPGWAPAPPDSGPEGQEGNRSCPTRWRFLHAGGQSLSLHPSLHHSSSHPPSPQPFPPSLLDSVIVFHAFLFSA